jgi:hypothetical protein
MGTNEAPDSRRRPYQTPRKGRLAAVDLGAHSGISRGSNDAAISCFLTIFGQAPAARRNQMSLALTGFTPQEVTIAAEQKPTVRSQSGVGSKRAPDTMPAPVSRFAGPTKAPRSAILRGRQSIEKGSL